MKLKSERIGGKLNGLLGKETIDFCLMGKLLLVNKCIGR